MREMFQLYWQEMDVLVTEEEKATPRPSLFTPSEYRQLAYEAMVHYDRAWQKFRRTGEGEDLRRSLWRHCYSGQEDMRGDHLHRLMVYVEAMKQRSNKWSEEQLTVGNIDWGPLPAELRESTDVASTKGETLQ